MSRHPDGVVRSPNIWLHPDTYEVGNRALDPDGAVEAVLADLAPTAGATVLDVGCGAGFHLPGLAVRAARVVGLEPHPPLRARARRRVAAAGPAVRRRTAVVGGSAEAVPLAGASVDVAHARWSYFFGPGCEPGLAELARVVRPGGTACLVDVDPTRSTFGAWFRAAHPGRDPLAVERFFARHGFDLVRVPTRWEFDSREDLEAHVRIELPPPVAEPALARHRGRVLDTSVAVRWRRYPSPTCA